MAVHEHSLEVHHHAVKEHHSDAFKTILAIKKRFWKTVRALKDYYSLATGAVDILTLHQMKLTPTKFHRHVPFVSSTRQRSEKEAVLTDAHPQRTRRTVSAGIPRQKCAALHAPRRPKTSTSSEFIVWMDYRVDSPKGFGDQITWGIQTKLRSRAKSANLDYYKGVYAFKTNALLSANCPMVLRRQLAGEVSYLGCRCSNKMPTLTDLEFDNFLWQRQAAPEQILVLWVVSASNFKGLMGPEQLLQSMHQAKSHNRIVPCKECQNDPYRLVKYDLDCAARFTNTQTPLLVERNHIHRGMILLYAGEKLLYGGSIFDGFGTGKKNLLQQIARAQTNLKMGRYLPANFKFSTVSPKESSSDSVSQKEPNNNAVYGLDKVTSSTGSLLKEKRSSKGTSGRNSALDFVLKSLSDMDYLLVSGVSQHSKLPGKSLRVEVNPPGNSKNDNSLKHKNL
nr:PREDICTED: uncharacterized protein LOC102352316 [Latimeria chalumnae]|eukprot:XP_014345031.1 PREDICTED: uncharacterized protein LOC102352316 [Latimeria chalumnae]